MLVETPGGTSVRIRREFRAPVARVYAAFTKPDLIAAWMWGSMGANVTAAADVRAGGRYQTFTDAPAGNEDAWHDNRWGMSGVYAVVEPDHRLVYTLHWEGPVGYNAGNINVADEVVVVVFEPSADGTYVDLRHYGIPDDARSAATHAEGIAETFDHLARLVEAG